MAHSRKSLDYLIVAGDFVRTGGMDRANLALAEYLARNASNESQIHLIAHRASESVLNSRNIQFHKVPKPLNSNWLGEPLLNQYGKSLIRQNHDPCVIVNGGNCRSNHISINWVHYVHAAWVPSTYNIPHSSPLRQIKQRLSHKSALNHERIALNQSPLIIANSNLTKYQISSIYQIDPARIEVVYYGTDQQEFSPVSIQERETARMELNLEQNRPVVVFVGALGDSRKGFDILYDAWKIVVDGNSDWDAQLLVVGSGKLISYYQSLRKSGACPQSIQFLGFRNDVRKILASADLLVSPTRYEAYGLNVHEALCRNIPVLVSQSAGVAERFPETSPENPAQMTLSNNICGRELAEKLIHWRDHQLKFAESAALTGDLLRMKSWDEQMEALIRHHSR